MDNHKDLEDAEVKPKYICAAIKYLEDGGMREILLDRMHHRNGETYAAARRYWCSKVDPESERLHPQSIAYGKRVIYVMRRHRDTQSGFEDLVEEALHNWPIDH
jgi:hypothetical protein